MNSAKKLCLLLAFLLLSFGSVEAQHFKKTYRVGIITRGFFAPGQVEAFTRGMHDLGYREGKNLIIEVRAAEGSPHRLSGFVAELLRLNVDVFVSNSPEAIQMISEMSKSTPIVMSSISDPLGSGLVESLAKPGGNITGLSLFSTDLAGKRLELLKETIPQINNVGVLVLRDHPPTRVLIPEMEIAARTLNLSLTPREIAKPEDYEDALLTFRRSRAAAIFVQNNAVFHKTFNVLIRIASKHRMPTFGPSNAFA